MDLRYSDADESFRKEVRSWLDDAVPAYGAPPPSGDWAARRSYDTGWQRLLHDAGFAGLNWPAEWGGRGLPSTQQLVFLEDTRAERRGDDYVVNGQKIWSTRAHVADYCELLVRTDADAAKHAGITWLILDMRQPGIEVRPMKTIDGDSHFCEVFLDDVRVPVANRVGAENDGWRVANVTLRFERGTAFAQHIILLRSQLRRVVGMAAGDGDDAGFCRRVGRLDARVDALWRMTQRCVTDAERSGVPSPMGSAVKLGYSELGQEIAKLGMEVLGRQALGSTGPDRTDAQVVHDYLWSFQYTIAAGTSQIQRNLIAERILGLPKGR